MSRARKPAAAAVTPWTCIEIPILRTTLAAWLDAHRLACAAQRAQFPNDPDPTTPFEEWIVNTVDEKLSADLCQLVQARSPKALATLRAKKAKRPKKGKR